MLLLPNNGNFKVFDVLSGRVESINSGVQDLHAVGLQPGVAMQILNSREVLFCGGAFGDTNTEEDSKKAFIFNLYNSTMKEICSMHYTHKLHGIAKIGTMVYVIGGSV
jgi:hypothetical protein